MFGESTNNLTPHLYTILHKWTGWQAREGWWGGFFELQCCKPGWGRQSLQGEKIRHRRSTWNCQRSGWSLRLKMPEQKPRWWPTEWTPSHTPEIVTHCFHSWMDRSNNMVMRCFRRQMCDVMTPFVWMTIFVISLFVYAMFVITWWRHYLSNEWQS